MLWRTGVRTVELSDRGASGLLGLRRPVRNRDEPLGLVAPTRPAHRRKEIARRPHGSVYPL